VLTVESRDAESAYDRVRLFDRVRNLLHQSMCPYRTFVQRSLRTGSGGLETGEKPVEWSVKGSGEYLEGTVWGGLSMENGAVQTTLQESPAATAAERAGCWVVPVSAFLLTAVILGIVQVVVDPPGLLLERFWGGGGWLELLVLSGYAAFLAGRLRDPSLRPRWRRRLWRLFSAVFFAQLALGLSGLDRFLMTGELHLPVPALIAAGPLYRGEGLFMPILFGATVLLVGPAWCSYLCYIGAWDGLAADRRRAPQGMPSWRRPAQVGVLVAVVGVALGLRWAGVSSFAALMSAVVFGLGGVAVMATISRRRGVMVHCTTYCPIGVLATRLGRINPFRIRLGGGCDGCGACSRACRYDALRPADIERRRPGSACTLCGDCVPKCREGHMGYSFPGLDAGKAAAVFVVLVAALHAAFLGVARI